MVQENEGAKFWLQVLTDLKQRGVKDILIACVDGFVGELERQGYSPIGATLQARLMARVSSWLQAEGLVCGALTGEVVERFLAECRAAGRRDL